jgi:hypothetical protein
MKTKVISICTAIVVLTLLIAFATWPRSNPSQPAAGPEVLGPPFAETPAQIVYGFQLKDAKFLGPPPEKVEYEAFRQRYANIFNAAILTGTPASKVADRDSASLYRFDIRLPKVWTGSLYIDKRGKVVYAVKDPLVHNFGGNWDPEAESGDYYEGLAAITVKRGRFSRTGFMDLSGRTTIPLKFPRAQSFREGLAPVFISEEKDDGIPLVGSEELGHWGYIDRQGNVVISPRFYLAERFSNGFARVQRDYYHIGLINTSGEYVWQMALPTADLFERWAKINAESPPEEKPQQRAHVSLTLRTHSPRIKLGQIPKFRAELNNRGPGDIVVVRPGDGSSRGARTPIIRWSPRMRTSGIIDCAFVAPVELDEIVILKPGQEVTLSDWIDAPTLDKVGRHRVILEIENIPGLKWGGFQGEAYEASTEMARVRRSTPFVATSNAVEIEVVE